MLLLRTLEVLRLLEMLWKLHLLWYRSRVLLLHWYVLHLATVSELAALWSVEVPANLILVRLVKSHAAVTASMTLEVALRLSTLTHRVELLRLVLTLSKVLPTASSAIATSVTASLACSEATVKISCVIH